MTWNIPWLVGIGSVLAVIIGGWGHIKNLWARLLTYVISVNRVDELLGDAIVSRLCAVGRPSRFGEQFFTAKSVYVRPLRMAWFVAFRAFTPSAFQIFWLGWTPIWISTKAQQSSQNGPLQVEDAYRLRISFFRGTVSITQLIHDALRAMSDPRTGSQVIRRYQVCHVFGQPHGDDIVQARRGRHPLPPSGSTDTQFQGHVPLEWQWSDLGPPQSLQAIKTLSLSPEMEYVVTELRQWQQLQTWFDERGLTWRRGYLFHGPPGSGKTSFVRAIAEEFDLPIFIYDLSSLSNHEMLSAWSQMLATTPCVALLEDFDAVFDGRTNTTSQYTSGGLTFDCVLNCLDGVERNNGLLTFITTNRVDKLDPALGTPSPLEEGLSTRPSRIDRVVEFRALDADGKWKMARRILGGDSTDIDGLVRMATGDTAAQFQERCVRQALKRLLDTPKAPKLISLVTPGTSN